MKDENDNITLAPYNFFKISQQKSNKNNKNKLEYNANKLKQTETKSTRFIS